MIEDKLTHDERLRLECVAQAVQAHSGCAPSAEQIVEHARRLEDFITAAPARSCSRSPT